MNAFARIMLYVAVTFSVAYTFLGAVVVILKILMPDKAVIVVTPWPFVIAAITVLPLCWLLRKVNKLRQPHHEG